MSRKLYVGNLPYDTDEAAVRSLFGAYGSVESVHLPTDKMTGRPRGFAFVEMGTSEEAEAAISGANGQNVGGRSLTVNEERPDAAHRSRVAEGSRLASSSRLLHKAAQRFLPAAEVDERRHHASQGNHVVTGRHLQGQRAPE